MNAAKNCPKCLLSTVTTCSQDSAMDQGPPGREFGRQNPRLSVFICGFSLAGTRVLWVALLIAVLLSSGCQTPSGSQLFTTSGPGWRVQEGQALWRPRRGFPELGGDIVMASNDSGCCLIQFAKTPLTLLVAQTTRTNWLIEFPGNRMRFGGRHKPTTRFAWLYLRTALDGDSLPAGLKFERKPDGGWRLENSSSGESVEGFLTP